MSTLLQRHAFMSHMLHEHHLDPSKISSFKKKSHQALTNLLSKCIKKIQEMANMAKTNHKLDKYFREAGTNSKYIQNGFSKLKQNLLIIETKFKIPSANLIIIGDVLEYIDQILTDNSLLQMQNIQKAIWILEFQSKVICCMELIMNSLYLPYDITTMKKQMFQKVWDKIKIQQLQNHTIAEERINSVKKIIKNIVATLIHEKKQSVDQSINFGVLSYYSFFDAKSRLRSLKFYRKPTIDQAKNLLDLADNGIIKQIIKLGMANIVTNQKIYIPFDQTKEPKDIFTDDGQSLQLRILHNEKIYSKEKKKQGFQICTPNIIQNHQDIETIIFFIHGGAFFAGSSRASQLFTRQWAVNLKIPIIAVDYRMAPKNRFPTAPLDCLNAYRFVVTKIHKYLNIKPKKIILAGESAGGNLVFSLSGLILKQKLPIPHGIYTAYPSTILSQNFTPSRLYSFTDPVLNPAMVLLVLDEYLGKDISKGLNPIASPLLYTQQFIGGTKGDKRFPLKWPKTIIHVGSNDPLYDDSLLMMQRMVSSNIDCQCHVYQNVPHGFLNLGGVFVKTIKDAQKHFEKLLK